MITFDFETKSYADLKKVGAWAYSQDPTTEVICACYAIDDQPVQSWVPGQTNDGPHGMPTDLYMAIMTGHEVEAHNVFFEISIWINVCARKYGWIVPLHHQWRDTAAVACYYAMPRALDRLAVALGFPGKNADGARLITKYSKLHLKMAKSVIPPDDLQKFIDYCRDDVLLEQAVSDELGDLPERELPVFLLDLQINLRGLNLDVAGIEMAQKIVLQRGEELTTEFEKLVGYKPTQLPKVKAWLEERGVVLDNMQAETLEELLENEGDDALPQGEARRAIEFRLKINKASAKKLVKMQYQVSEDGTAKGQTRYHGAGTGRNTGDGIQPLNMVRSWEDVAPEDLVRDIMYGDPAWLDTVYGDAMEAISKASRHWIKAPDGMKIMSGDFVSVEAVILSCLAGEQWKIDAFRKKHPIYAIMGAKIHKIDPGEPLALGDKGFKKKYPAQRQDGKTGELAFGYQGGLGAWLNFDSSGRHTDEAIHSFKDAWRKEHPMIADSKTGLWRMLENAAIDAVRYPGKTTGYRQIGFQTVDEWLSMILPDGKRIWYRDPELRAGMPPWHKPKLKTITVDGREEPNPCATGSCKCRPIPKLTYMAQKEGQWKRVSTYGGKLTENATQAVSRQRLVPSMMRAEKAGYEVRLSVYDEIVCMVPTNFGSKKEFKEIMLEPAGEWDADWPIDVDVWDGLEPGKDNRYTK